MSSPVADENYVEILVKARDESAVTDLDRVKEKLDELDRKVADARVTVTDAGDAAKLDRFAAKLDDLDHKVASPRIRLAGALRAEAEIHAIEASLDDLKRKSEETGAEGAIGTFLNGAGGSGAAGGPAGIAALAVGFTLLAEQIAAILGPLAAAGIGLGAFGALAIPTLDKVKNAYSGVTTAQKNYQAAVALDKLDPTKAHAAAAAAALDKLKLAWQGMSPLTRDAVKGIQGIVSQFSGMARQVAPEVLKIFDDLLPGIHQLIGDLGPFAKAIGPVLDKMAKSFSQFTMSPGFKDFLNQMLKLSGPALATIGEGIAKIAIAIGKVLEAGAAHGGLKDLARDFRIVADVIQGLGTWLARGAQITATRIADIIHWIKDLIQYAKDLYHWWIDAWEAVSRASGRAETNIAGQIRIIIGWARSLGSFIARVYGSDIPHWIGVAVQWFSSMPGRILHAFSGFGNLLYSSGQALLQGLLNGIESMVGSIIKAAESVGTSILNGIKGALGISSPSREGFAIGANFGDAVDMGLTSRLGKIAATAAKLGRAAVPPRHGAGAGGYGSHGAHAAAAFGGHGHGVPLRLVVTGAGTSDPLMRELIRSLRFEIRAGAGGGPDSVQQFLGRTA